MPDRSQPRFHNRAPFVNLVDAADVRCARTAHSEAEEERSDVPTLVVTRHGVFRCHAGRRTTIADVNTVVLLHPDEPYRITHPTDRGDRCIALRFDRDAVADALGAGSESGAAWTLGAGAQRAVQRAASAVLNACETLEREERAFDVLAIVAGTHRVVTGTRDAPRIEGVRERLAADPGARSSLAEIARDAGLSPYHLARRFRAATGTSLHQYRLALRLGTAAAMLEEGAGDLTFLAHELGFAGSAHFSTAFRRAYGCAPSAYARRSCGRTGARV